MYKSERNFPLICQEKDPFFPVITVEDYDKWYCLYAIHPDGHVEALNFPEYLCDHVPNPQATVDLAEKLHYTIDGRSLEVIVGRWCIEHDGYFDD